MEEHQKRLGFTLRVIQNKIKAIVCSSIPPSAKRPQSQLQGGILDYLYHHQEQPVYQRDIEKEFRISGATATNTLQALDKDARLKRILITEEALQGHRRVEEQMDGMERRLTQGLSPEETAELHRMLDIVLDNLEEWQQETGAGEPEERPDG